MHLLNALWILSVWCCCSCWVNGWEYCLPEIEGKICKNKKHIACSNITNAFQSDGKTVAKSFGNMLPLTPKVIARILGHLNRYRDIIASGNAENENTKAKFPKASRMRELIWDWELCYLAEIHVKFLAVAYDNCRNTLRHPRSGQTIGNAMYEVWPPLSSIFEELFGKLIQMKDNINDPSQMPKKFLKEFIAARAFEFTILVSDRASRVGCSVAVGNYCSPDPDTIVMNCYYLACNYDIDNKRDELIYQEGEPASACSFWHTEKSSTYANLCANNGEIFSKDIM